MRKILSLLLTALFILAAAVPARAEPVTFVQTFGYTQARNREGLTAGGLIIPVWFCDEGRSYSQPLLFNGEPFGFKPKDGDPDSALAISVMNGGGVGRIYGFEFPSGMLKPRLGNLEWRDPLWSKELSAPTKGEATLFKWKNENDGRDHYYLLVGTESQYLDVFDVTDFMHPQLVNRYETPYTTDIISAPTVFNWHGHLAVVYTCGNTGNIAVTFDPLDSSKKVSYYIPLGSGRTSSSPAPVFKSGPGPYDYEGFAVGRDQGQNAGKLYVIRFDDFFSTEGGKVVPKPKQETSFYAVEDLPAGLVASFCVSDDGFFIYFGDCRSRFYCYNVATKKFVWKNMDSSVAGMFSNRSPAMSGDKVIFPANTKPGQIGAVIALDRATGQEVWTYRFNSSAPQYAPSIMRGPHDALVLVPTTTLNSGYIAFIDYETGQKRFNPEKLCRAGDPDGYAMGSSGGLSFVGFRGVTADSMGTAGWFIVPYLDFEAVKLDPGVPEGEKAKSGQTYTATVEFGSHFDTWFSGLDEVGIDADVNGQPTVITDVYGQELPTQTAWGKTFYVLRPVPAQDGKWTVKFNWTAPAADKAVLRAWINLEMGRINATWPENDGATPEDPKNNLVQAEVPVEIQGVDLSVTASPAMDPFRMGFNQTSIKCPVNIVVRRKDSGQPVTVKLFVESPLGNHTEAFTLGPGGLKKTAVLFTAYGPGSYPVKVQAWPERAQDLNPDDNVAYTTVRVVKNSPPNIQVPREPGIHVEKGGQ